MTMSLAMEISFSALHKGAVHRKPVSMGRRDPPAFSPSSSSGQTAPGFDHRQLHDIHVHTPAHPLACIPEVHARNWEFRGAKTLGSSRDSLALWREGLGSPGPCLSSVLHDQGKGEVRGCLCIWKSRRGVWLCLGNDINPL